MSKYAKFSIGELVLHKQHGYRAVIVDVDPLFQASGRYNPLANKHHFAGRNPWYRLLVDGSAQMTYVEENYLVQDENPQSIHNPNISEFLTKQKGRYRSNMKKH